MKDTIVKSQETQTDRCTAENVVYKATVKRLDNQTEETYNGLTTSFK